jgi:hypothetical protein
LDGLGKEDGLGKDVPPKLHFKLSGDDLMTQRAATPETVSAKHSARRDYTAIPIT